jgi:hypothetical protein
MKRTILVPAVLSVHLLVVVSALGATPQEQYDATYGEDAKKAVGPAAKAFAERLVAAAKDAKDAPDFQALLCERAYEFGARHPSGHAAAEAGMTMLAALRPDRRSECEGKVLDLYEKALLAAGKGTSTAVVTAARRLMRKLVVQAGANLEAGAFKAASVKYRRAHDLAGTMKWPDALIAGRRADFTAAQAAAEVQAAALAKKLDDKPDEATARKLLMLHLTERDDPPKAAELLDKTGPDEELRSYLPLAVKPWIELDQAQCMELGKWYERLAGKAVTIGKVVPMGKVRMLQRAKGYYEAWVVWHGRRDGAAVPALEGIRRAEAALSKLGGGMPGGFLGPPDCLSKELIEWIRQRDALPAAQQVQAIQKKLSELNAGKVIKPACVIENGRIVEVNVGGQGDLTSIAPLYGLKLRKLDLAETSVSSLSAVRGMRLTYLRAHLCTKVKDLRDMEGMPLESIYISSFAPDSFEPLWGAPVSHLQINATHVSDLGPIGNMPLRELLIVGAPNLDLEMLRGMELTNLGIAYCPAPDLRPLAGMPVEELGFYGGSITSLLPLQKLPIRILRLYECKELKSLDGIWAMPLVELVITDTPFSNEKTSAELKKRIPTLKTVQIARPAKP